MLDSDLLHLRIGTGWIEVQILSPYPLVAFRNHAYAPVLEVKVERSGLRKMLFVSAHSLSEQLEDIRKAHGSLEDVRVRLRKTSDDRFARYVVEELDGKAYENTAPQ